MRIFENIFQRPLRIFYEGMGNIEYETPSQIGAGGAAAANNGVSVSGSTIVLGNDQGASIAKLLSNRDIPLNGFMVQFLQNVLTDFVQILRSQVLIGGSPTAGAIPTLGLANFDDGDQLILTVDALGVHMQFGGGSFINFSLLNGWTFTNRKVDFIAGFGGPIPADSFPGGIGTNPNGAGIMVDTSGGNINYTLDPVAMKDRLFWIKKKTTDVNSITITPSTGQIFANAGGAASYTFGGPGEATLIGSDGINFFVL